MDRMYITEYNIIDHGIDHNQYWPGQGSGDYDHIITGYGDNQQMAVEDLLEQFGSEGYITSDDLESELILRSDEEDIHTSCREEFKNFSPEDPREEYVDGLILLSNLFTPILQVFQHDLGTRNNGTMNIITSLIESYNNEKYEKFDEWHEECELAYRVSLQFNDPNSPSEDPIESSGEVVMDMNKLLR